MGPDRPNRHNGCRWGTHIGAQFSQQGLRLEVGFFRWSTVQAGSVDEDSRCSLAGVRHPCGMFGFGGCLPCWQ